MPRRVRELSRYGVVLVAALLACFSARAVTAAEPAHPLAARAEQLLAFMNGTLDPAVDPAPLLVLDLRDAAVVGADGERVRAILRSVSDPPAVGRASARAADPIVLDGMEPAAAFEAVYAAYLRLPPGRRDELAALHEAKRTAASAEASAEQRRAAAVAATQTLADHLEAYLGGTLDVSVEPASLLQVDLGASTEFALAPERRAAWLAPRADPSSEASSGSSSRGASAPHEPDASAPGASVRATGPGSGSNPHVSDRAPQRREPNDREPSDHRPDDRGPGEHGPDATDLFAAQARLDGLRRTFLALPLERREALAERHEQRVEAAADAQAAAEIDAPSEDETKTAQIISDAELEARAAASARVTALEAARLAKTEAKRILAEERARLLGIKEAQALHEAELNRRKTERDANHDKALEWTRKVSAVVDSPGFASEKAREADPMYQLVRADLATMRRQLRDELRRIRRAGSDVPAVGEGLDRDLPSDVDRGDLANLRAELLRNEKSLIELEKTVGWALAQGLRDDVVLLNRTRLALLEIASSGLRAAVTGFGQAGVDQVEREFDQITVELKFHALKFPRYRETVAGMLRGSTLVLLIGTSQLVLVLVLYGWWRRRGPILLSRLENLLRSRRSATRLESSAATTLWYLQRVRRPLELLLVLWVLLGLLGNVDDLPELGLLWIVALWVLLGMAVILFVDALAARETLYAASTQDTGALRIHSLRLVGLNVIAVGLVLSLTSATVGRGAIYRWVISTCWILSFPVAIYLIQKWKPIIFARVEQRAEQGAFTRWVTAREHGVASFPAAATGGLYLISDGLLAWAMRQLSGLEATRRLLAYLFRREVAKQAAATQADDRYQPIDPAVYDSFDPERIPELLLGQVATRELERVAKLVRSSRSTLTAVVGERGAGKSSFLRRLATEVEGTKVRVVTCPDEGFAALQLELAKLAGAPALRDGPLCEALRKLGPLVLAVDDIQRLVVPAVNGLRELDAFTAFAREVGGKVSWVVAIGSASWHYINRVRGDSVFFEEIVHVPRWSEDQLGALIQAQCTHTGIEPSFDGLVVPRQADAPLAGQGDRTEAGYYRLLWDFSRGNPAVALHAFRESLFTTPDGDVVVRLFKEPSPEQIEALSMPVLFVLRAVVQLELAVADEVEAATQLPASDISDAIRFCLSRGYLVSFQAGVRVAWPWYRTITTVLQRQHLLSTL